MFYSFVYDADVWWQARDKQNSAMNVYARMTVGSNTKTSSVKYKTNKPHWDENFQFFVEDPEMRHVVIEVCMLRCSALYCLQNIFNVSIWLFSLNML